MNYLIFNNPKDNQSLQISTHIAAYLINQLDLNLYIITKEKVNNQLVDLRRKIQRPKALKLGLVTAVDYNTLLRKILFLDNLPIDRIPQVLILESLHLWFEATSPDRFHQISSLIAAFLDLINVWSRLIEKPCYGLIVINEEQILINLAENFFEDRVKTGKQVDDILEAIKNHQLN